MDIFRRLFSILSAVLFCFFLVSCNDKGPQEAKDLDPQNPVLITIWHYYNGPQKIAFDKLVSAFNETVGFEKGIIVEAFSQGGISQLHQKVKDAAEKKVGSDTMPDIFSAYADNALVINNMGCIAAIDQYMSRDKIAEYVSAYIDEGRIDSTGQLKIFPIAKTTEVLMLNATDWQQFAAATGARIENLATWEGIAETARQYYEWTDSLTPRSGDGKAFFGRDAFANYMIIGSKQIGHEITRIENSTLVIDINPDVMRRLWDNYYVPYIRGYYAANGRFRSDDIKMGDIIAMVGATTGAPYFPEEVTISDQNTYPINFTVCKVPGFEGTQPYAVQQGAGMLVTKSTPVKEYAAVEFLRWITEEGRNISFSISSGYLPVKISANDINRIKAEIEKTDNFLISDGLKQALDIAAYQVQNYTMYTAKPHESSEKIRNIFEKSMPDRAKEDRAKVLELEKKGMSAAEAEALFITDENFEQWFTEFSNEVISQAAQ